LFAPFQFCCFPCSYRFDGLVRMRDRAHHIFIQNTHAARSDCAGGQFLKTGDTEFAHDKNVKRNTQAF
jgi:hypothetical protein